MNESKCVSLYWDVFRFGFAIQLIEIVGLLIVENTMDWPIVPEDVTLMRPGAVMYVKPVAFLILSIIFWLRFAVVLQNIRNEAIRQSGEGGAAGDFLGRIGLGGINWMFTGFALFTAWHAIFDDQRTSIASIVTVLIYGLAAAVCFSRCAKTAA